MKYPHNLYIIKKLKKIVKLIYLHLNNYNQNYHQFSIKYQHHIFKHGYIQKILPKINPYPSK